MKRLVVMGGGVWVPRLAERLAAAWRGEAMTLTLVAQQADRLAIIARHTRARLARWQAEWRVEHTPNVHAALEGAEAVVLLVRVGGWRARAHDETFPQTWGVAGDEGLGPGGVANAYRTLPWVDALTQALAERCPSAWILNMMAPLGVTTRALLDAGLRAVGVCELPAVTLKGLGSGPDRARYGGLNHLGWFWDVAGVPGVHPLKYYTRIFGQRPSPPTNRAQALHALSAHLLDAFASRADAPPAEALRPTLWFEEALVPALVALAGGEPWEGFANVANHGLLAELPDGHVVEVAARWARGDVRAVSPGRLPKEVTPLLRAVARSEQLSITAARTGDADQVAQAIAALPLDLTPRAVRALAARAVEEVSP